ncbi:MAG: hypothetical protein P4L70_00800 [Parasulfuritortus sp.]|nr:hypothetical protein [Parasulfuritortus sp.]
MEITIYRDPPLAHEERLLPATTYNLAHTLLSRSNGALFVPVRSMQFLAIVDAEEIVFVDHEHKSLAVLAWQHFRPQARASLDQPVPYEAVYYRDDGAEIMRRMQAEFPKALTTLADKERPDGPASVLKFERKTVAD